MAMLNYQRVPETNGPRIKYFNSSGGSTNSANQSNYKSFWC